MSAPSQKVIILTAPSGAGKTSIAQFLLRRFPNLSFSVSATTRAFASLTDFTSWSAAALKPGGVWMAMKGRVPDEEIAALPAGVRVDEVQLLQVPGLEAQRCVVWMRQASLLGSDSN